MCTVFGHCSCYNIIIIKLNCQSEVEVLRVKNEKFPKITLTKTEVNIMVIVGTILISVGASILFVLKVNSVKGYISFGVVCILCEEMRICR